jgi:hypothetical protein
MHIHKYIYIYIFIIYNIINENVDVVCIFSYIIEMSRTKHKV